MASPVGSLPAPKLAMAVMMPPGTTVPLAIGVSMPWSSRSPPRPKLLLLPVLLNIWLSTGEPAWSTITT